MSAVVAIGVVSFLLGYMLGSLSHAAVPGRDPDDFGPYIGMAVVSVLLGFVGFTIDWRLFFIVCPISIVGFAVRYQLE